jgi:hypothetical protein
MTSSLWRACLTMAWYHSPAYQAILPLRLSSAKTTASSLKGCRRNNGAAPAQIQQPIDGDNAPRSYGATLDYTKRSASRHLDAAGARSIDIDLEGD